VFIIPTFVAHHIICNKILENTNFNVNDFTLGNLLPDADDDTDDSHASSHFRAKINNGYEKYSNLEKFVYKYRNHFNDCLLPFNCVLEQKTDAVRLK
jgi:hypothetical protein